MEKIDNINKRGKASFMQKNKLNNVIVLKNISSNIVEEAIVVLKPYVNLKYEENKAITSRNENKLEKNKCILKEAEFVIENYISQIEIKKNEKEKKQMEKKYKALKKVLIFASVLNFFLLLKIF